MFANVAGINSGGSVSVSKTEKFCMPDGFGLYERNADVAFDGVIVKKESKYDLTGRVSAKLKFTCSRCLEPVEVVVWDDVLEVFSENPPGDSEDWPFKSAAGHLDITECLKAVIVSAAPMKVLCREDCLGLCPYCGKNLNYGDCGCESPSNLVFGNLSRFFDDEEV